MAYPPFNNQAQAGQGIFVYRPQPPRQDMTGSKAYHMVCLGVSVSRFPRETTAAITLRAREGTCSSVLTRSMTAAQCEDMARALLDAAADLRRVDTTPSEDEDTQDDEAEASAGEANGGAA